MTRLQIFHHRQAEKTKPVWPGALRKARSAVIRIREVLDDDKEDKEKKKKKYGFEGPRPTTTAVSDGRPRRRRRRRYDDVDDEFCWDVPEDGAVAEIVVVERFRGCTRRLFIITTNLVGLSCRLFNMPRCLMAKKWKAYPWPDRLDDPQQQQHEQNGSVGIEQEHVNNNTNNGHDLQRTISNLVMDKKHHRHHHEPEDEEIDVVGDTDNRQVDHQQTCWGPHSPTAGTTAPSPPPLNASGALYYHGETFHFSHFN
ncbi:hypothetical protein M0804_015076 [Polistes exclamans]|nr:hypothetical protein M0804_015078 [Polistes exclamans]KAI4473968.1 hypothetical protein M0804_015076 [Polistes exclamans]